MTIQDLGNLGEAIGGIAVLATLIYVALQMRQTTRQLEQNTDLLRVTADAELHRDASEARWRVASSREMMELWLAGLAGGDLDTIDQARFEQLLGTLFHSLLFEFRRVEEGVLPSDSERFWKAILSAPGVVSWWERTKPIYSPDFARAVDALIRD